MTEAGVRLAVHLYSNLRTQAILFVHDLGGIPILNETVIHQWLVRFNLLPEKFYDIFKVDRCGRLFSFW